MFLACCIDYSWLIKGENKLLNKYNVLMNDSFQNRVIPLEKDYKRAFVWGISASCFVHIHIQHTKRIGKLIFFNCFLGLFKKIHYSFTLLSVFRMCYYPDFKDEWDFAFRYHYELRDFYIFMCFSPLQSFFLWSSDCLTFSHWEPLLVGSYVLCFVF